MAVPSEAEHVPLTVHVVAKVLHVLLEIHTPYINRYADDCDEVAAIYQQPATSFVAQFIGTTNYLDGTIVRQADGLWAITPAGAVPLGTHQANPALVDGTEVRVLIRPEDLALVPSDAAHIRGTITQLQFLGDRLRLVVQCMGNEALLIADVEPRTAVATGELVALQIRRATPLLVQDA